MDKQIKTGWTHYYETGQQHLKNIGNINKETQEHGNILKSQINKERNNKRDRQTDRQTDRQRNTPRSEVTHC